MILRPTSSLIINLACKQFGPTLFSPPQIRTAPRMTTTPQGEVKTRFCIVSDTHNSTPFPPTFTNTPYRLPFPSADVFLHAGDLTMVGKQTEHRIMVDMFKRVDAEIKIIIPGNHDITLDEKYYNDIGYRKHREREDLAKIRDLYCGEEAQRHGIVYIEEGVRTFKLKNGAQFTIYASAYQPEFCRWAFAYDRDEDRFNPPTEGAAFRAPNPIPSFPQVDIVMTHGPPAEILDETNPGDFAGCAHLRQAMRRVRPRLHCFGHIHEGHGAERMTWANETREEIEQTDWDTLLKDRHVYINASSDGEKPLKFGEETLFVNASIMTVRYKPVNAPFVVDLDLPRVSEA